MGAESKVPVGILDVKMDIIPRLPDVAPSEVVKTQLTLEKNRLNERQRLFLGKDGVGFCTQEMLTKLPRSTPDPLVVFV